MKFLKILLKVVPKETIITYLSSKVEIKLVKQSKVKWSSLEKPHDTAAPLVTPVNEDATAGRPDYPSSAKKKINWDDLNKNIEEDKPDGKTYIFTKTS